MAKVKEFWLISVPGDTASQHRLESLNKETAKRKLSKNWKFNVPGLKVGTLDKLVGLSDELRTVDSYTEQVTRKVATYLKKVLGCTSDELLETKVAGGQDIYTYLTNFQWDMAKFPVKQPLKNIMKIISKEASDIEAELKKRSKSYNSMETELQNKDKEKAGSLLTRSIGDLVRREHFVVGSEYLTTLAVIVSLPRINEWNLSYEILTDMVVPRSSEIVFQDNKYALLTVTLFRKAVDEFKHKAKENKFIVKDFEFNPEEAEAKQQKLIEIATDIKKLHGPLVRWLKTHFGEMFVAWLHVKALRVFSESTLWYGLPVNFNSILLLPEKKAEKRLRQTLNKLYGDLDSSAPAHEVDFDIPSGLGFNSEEDFPYISFKVNLDLTGSKDSLHI